MQLSLEKIIKYTNGNSVNCSDSIIKHITTDTRDVREGSLFVALKGEKFDGHDFCVEAVKRGATAVLSQRKADEFSEKIPTIEVKDTYDALLKLAKGYREELDVNVVAVTGSVGKTTTKDMIAAILAQAIPTVKTQGNLNNHIGVPKTVFGITDRDKAAVIEMGMNHFGEISRLTDVARPDIAVITSIGISHIENLGSREGILKAKLEILEGMESYAPLIINGDDDMLSSLELDRRIIKTSVQDENADIFAKNITQGTEGSRFDIYVKGEFFQNVYLSAVGIHNVQNSLLAVGAALYFGIPKAQIASGLACYVPSGMRQKLTRKNGITFIEDCYNASPASMFASLSVLSSISEGRKIAVLGDMLELGEIAAKEHYKVGVKAAEESDIIITCGRLSEKISQGAQSLGKQTKNFSEKEECAKYLLEILKEGDTVLFKASHSMEFEKIISFVYNELEAK